LQLAPQLPLAQPPQQLLTRRCVDALGLGARVELREQCDPFGLERCAVEDVLADAPVQRIVEMLGCELAEERAEVFVRERTGERVSLEARAGVDDTRCVRGRSC
jgi:hypothetical protein